MIQITLLLKSVKIFLLYTFLFNFCDLKRLEYKITIVNNNYFFVPWNYYNPEKNAYGYPYSRT